MIKPTKAYKVGVGLRNRGNDGMQITTRERRRLSELREAPALEGVSAVEVERVERRDAGSVGSASLAYAPAARRLDGHSAAHGQTHRR